MQFIAVNKSSFIYAYKDLMTIRKDIDKDGEWEVSPINSYYFIGDYDRDGYIVYSKEEAAALYGREMVVEAELYITQLLRKLG